jgi:hypothetical protein
MVGSRKCAFLLCISFMCLWRGRPVLAQVPGDLDVNITTWETTLSARG